MTHITMWPLEVIVDVRDRHAIWTQQIVQLGVGVVLLGYLDILPFPIATVVTATTGAILVKPLRHALANEEVVEGLYVVWVVP